MTGWMSRKPGIPDIGAPRPVSTLALRCLPQTGPEDTISYLGIDIGGTKVALRAEGTGGRVREASFAWAAAGAAAAATASASGPAGGPRSGERDLAALAAAVRELEAAWAEPFQAVGVALPASLDRAGVVTTWPGRPGWVGLDLADRLRALAPARPVRWADDGDLAALAEADAAGCADLVYLGIGTGIGGGIVLGGRPLPGLDRGSCELGHVIVDPAGPVCDCGRRGCVQAFASGPAILRRAADLRGAAVPPDALGAGVRAGAPWAVTAVGEAAAALATLLASLTELVAPELALIGGGLAAGVPELVGAVAAELAALARPGHPPPPVRPAVLGGLSSLRGAVLLARGPDAGGGQSTTAASARAASR